MLFFALFGLLFLMTQYLHSVYDALQAGVRMLPVAGGLIVASGLSHRLDVLPSRAGCRNGWTCCSARRRSSAAVS